MSRAGCNWYEPDLDDIQSISSRLLGYFMLLGYYKCYFLSLFTPFSWKKLLLCSCLKNITHWSMLYYYSLPSNVVTKLQRLSLQRDSLICSEYVWFVMSNRFLSSSFRYLIDYRNNFRVIRFFLQLPQNKQTKRTCSVGFFWQKLEINKLVAGYEGDAPNSNSKWNLENNCTIHTWK